MNQYFEYHKWVTQIQFEYLVYKMHLDMVMNSDSLQYLHH